MPKGKIVSKSPVAVEVEAGKTYGWCSCGLTQNEPFCDGTHRGSEFHPIKFTAEENGKKYLCGCRQTDNQPFCDGQHKSL